MVGAAGFEPATSCSQGRRANQAALRPDVGEGWKNIPDTGFFPGTQPFFELFLDALTPLCYLTASLSEHAFLGSSAGRVPPKAGLTTGGQEELVFTNKWINFELCSSVAQLVESRRAGLTTEGQEKLVFINKWINFELCSSVAQLVEQVAVNHPVGGSSPSRGAIQPEAWSP